MSVAWCVLAWIVIATKSKLWWNAVSFWFVLAVINELANPICPGYITRSILFFACSFGFLLVSTGYVKPIDARK